MKVFLKSLVLCIAFAVTGMTALAAGGIKSASFNSNKMFCSGREVNLYGQRMISVVKNGEQETSNYIPIRGFLESMGYQVGWDEQQQAVMVTSPNYNDNEESTPVLDMNGTVVPTKELLNGCWTAVSIDLASYCNIDWVEKLYFDMDGNIISYYRNRYLAVENYFASKYSIDNDVLLVTTKARQNSNDEQGLLTGDGTERLLQCRLSKDGRFMHFYEGYESDYNYIFTFTKDDGAEFDGIADGFTPKGVKSAGFNSNRIILDGEELDLGGQQMISVVKDGEQDASNYMPVRGVLEAMGYTVGWDRQNEAVIATYSWNEEENEIERPILIVDPTEELLNGVWVVVDYGGATYYSKDDVAKLYFEAAGKIAFYYYDSYWDEESYIAGTYSIIDDTVCVAITYMDANDEVEISLDENADDYTFPISIWLSQDGSRMYYINGIHIFTCVKDDGEEFKKYQQ